MSFISDLSKKRSVYANPDQAATQAKSLEQISSGIYTEDERFIFELLQNAVDAFSDDHACLKIKMVVKDDYLVFMHNGDAFTERDIEGLCDVGNGNKTKDTKKIGYKGIGFKSVFMGADSVTISTGQYCFKFDKEEWDGYWDSRWKKSFGEKDPDKVYAMPWQIIPIEAEVPFHLSDTGYNVAIYIRARKIQSLSERIKALMSTSQFLLFLKTKNVKMEFYNGSKLQKSIEKCTQSDEVILNVDGKEESRWLFYSKDNVLVPEDLRADIAADQKTPEKLIVSENGKNLSVKTFDISFAVRVEQKDGKRVVKAAENPVLYTYLPTSYKFGDEGFPFLVNANFITDAGREHLIKDSEWNKLIISKIPKLYLAWVATFSKQIENYFDVLPKKNYGNGNPLLVKFNEAFDEAVKAIAFIPSSKTNNMLKASDALIDRIGIADALPMSMLLNHISRQYNKNYTADCLVANRGISILSKYGVFVFDKARLSIFLNDEKSLLGINSDSDYKLIQLLCTYSRSLSEQNQDIQTLSDIRFVLNQKGELASPKSICSLPIASANENIEYDYVKEDLYRRLSESEILWLKELGLSEPSDTSLIDTGKLFQKNFVTKDNAIKICTHFFELANRGKISEEQYVKLRELKLITQEGTLITANSAYLSNFYLPALPLETDYKKDWYISEKYCCNPSDKSKWKEFLLKIGVVQDAEIESPYVKLYGEMENQMTSEYRKEYIEQLFAYLHTIPGEWDWEYRSYAFFVSIRLLDEAVENYAFAKRVWYSIFNNATLDIEKLSRDIEVHKFYIWERQCYTMWLLEQKKVLPTTLHTCENKENVYSNAIPNIFDIAYDVLPILDYKLPLSDAWQSMLNLKDRLELEDYLMLLTNYSQRDKYDLLDLKNRIETIYVTLVDLFPMLNEQKKATIKDWAVTNKVLSANGNFCYPKDLSYITLDGFSSKNQIYCGKISNKDVFVELLKLLGVRIFTANNVTATFQSKNEDVSIRERLLSTVSFLALLASDNQTKSDYEQKRKQLYQQIDDTIFYSCETIQLMIEGSDAVINKQTYAEGKFFYYAGSLSPANLQPLLAPLCAYLKLRGKEQELFVLLVEPDYSALIKNFKDKDYHTDWIDTDECKNLKTTATTAEIGGRIGGGIDKERQIAESKEAQKLVLAKLKIKGFDVDNAKAEYSVINGIRKDNKEYPLVVKSCKNFEHRLDINPDEWIELFRPNSMLWIHMGNGVVVPIKAFELFTYQDKLTLSFDTVNILTDDRIAKIMQVMHYFNNVHLNLATLTPNCGRAEQMDDYLFYDNNTDNSDLSADSIDD